MKLGGISGIQNHGNKSACKAEELQWARILASGDPANGMVLVLGQKMKNNDLDSITGYAELIELGRATEAAETMDALARLEEKAHAINHTLCDSLEAICVCV